MANKTETETLKKMCEYGMCSEKAIDIEAYKGQLYNLCTGHRRLIRKQKKVDNNI